MKGLYLYFKKSHLENVTQTRNTSTKIENDLKYVNKLKTEPETNVTGDNSDTNKQSVLISDLNASISGNEATNSIEDNPESDAIRKRRLQHFQTSQ